MKLEDFSLKQLKHIVKIYNNYFIIENIDNINKTELINELEQHLYIDDNGINLKEHSFEISKPKKEVEPKSKVEPIQDYTKQEIPKNKRKCECGMITGISSQSIKNHNKTPIHQDYLRLIQEEPIEKEEQLKIMELINGVLSNRYGSRKFYHFFNALDKKYPFIADNIKKIYESKKGFDFYPTPTNAFENGTARWAIEHSSKILEPTAGLGAIITALLHINEHAQIEGNELNKDFIPILKKIFETENRVFITNYDFLEKDYTNNNYDLIVCNPPFTVGTDKRFYYLFLFKCLQILNNSKSTRIKKLIFISPALVNSDSAWQQNFRKNPSKNWNNEGWQYDFDSLLSTSYISMPVIKKVYEKLLNIKMYKSLENVFKEIISGKQSMGDREIRVKNKKTGEYEYKELSDDVSEDLDKFENNFEFAYGEEIAIVKGFGGTNINANMNFFEIHKNLYGLGKKKLKGKGILDYFIKSDKLTNKSQKVMDNLGNVPVKRIQIYRTPINSMISKALELISLGTFSTGEYDKLYHLAMVLTLENNKNIIVEKNSVINLSGEYKTTDKTEVLDIPFNKPITLKGMFDKTLNRVGNKKMYLYDAFGRGEATNCQGFIKEMLISENLYTPDVDKFVYQDLTNIQKNLNSYVPDVARVITDVGSIFGLGEHKNPNNYALHAIIVKKPVSKEALDKIHKDFIKNKNRTFIRETKNSYRIRNIPKTKFIKGTYRTKKVKGHPNLSMVFGELKA